MTSPFPSVPAPADPLAKLSARAAPLGLRAARWAGLALGAFLLVYGPYEYLQMPGTATPGDFAKAAFLAAYGLLLLLPLEKFPTRPWRYGFALLVLASAALVFVLIVTVMFGYMAAADRGERLGVPGFEGTLIFFGLLQIPVALFLRHPDMLE